MGRYRGHGIAQCTFTSHTHEKLHAGIIDMQSISIWTLSMLSIFIRNMGHTHGWSIYRIHCEMVTGSWNLCSGAQCCNIMVDCATSPKQNGVIITQKKDNIPISFHDCSSIKDERNKKGMCFCRVLKNIGLLWRESLYEQNSFCNAAVSESTVM